METSIKKISRGILLTTTLFFLARGNAPVPTPAEEYQDQLAVEELETNATETEGLPKEAINNTIAFLKNQSPVYALSTEGESSARERIKNGKMYLKSLASGTMNDIPVKFKNPFVEIQRSYLDAIIALCWALFDQAVREGHGFTGGTIVFEDKEYRIFNFLFDYATKANKDLASGERDPKYISQNCFAYERHSSHFPEMQNSYGQFGIDIRYGQGDLEKLLPANKSHILFGKILLKGKELSFIKMEVYGLCMRDASVVKHGLEFLKGTKGKKGPSRREDLPKQVKTLLGKMLNAIPKKFKADITTEIGKPEVIKNIYAVAKKLAMQKGTSGSKEAEDLVKYLDDNFDHLDIRRGNEVILVPLAYIDFPQR